MRFSVSFAALSKIMHATEDKNTWGRTTTLIGIGVALPLVFALGYWSGKPGQSDLANYPGSNQPGKLESPNSAPAGGKSDPSDPGSGTPSSEAVSVEVLSSEMIEALTAEAINEPSPLKRSLAFSKLLDSLTPENALIVMEAMKEHDATNDQWELFRYAWGAMDPAEAMRQAAALDRGEQKAIKETLTGWASANPADARDWVESLDDEDARSRYLAELVSGMADNNIEMATDYVLELAEDGVSRAHRYIDAVVREQLRSGDITATVAWTEALPNEELKLRAMERIADRYVSEDPEAAADWASAYAADESAARLIEEVGEEWAERDPEAALTWLSSLPEGEGRRDGVQEAIGEWANNDPAAAVDWLSNLAQGSMKEDAMQEAIGEWAERDPTAAGEYLLGMPNSPTKDSAMSGYARNVVREDPEAAIAWANTIAGEELRLQTVTLTAQEWFRRDRDAALIWLESSGLPDEIQLEVISPTRRR